MFILVLSCFWLEPTTNSISALMGLQVDLISLRAGTFVNKTFDMAIIGSITPPALGCSKACFDTTLIGSSVSSLNVATIN